MPRLGFCSWSVQPASPADLAAKAGVAGLDAVQLALDPIRAGAWPERDTVAILRDAGIDMLSGMMGFKGEDYTTLDTIRDTGGVRLDGHWSENLAAAHANAALADRLGLRLVTLHAGFIPHDRADPLRPLMLDRLRQVADAFSARGVRIALETGQESAATLLEALAELGRPHVGVNFDPANMILYGMGDPVTALRALRPRVAQVHIKDARPAPVPGQWGEEVPAGRGRVDWAAFFGALCEPEDTAAQAVPPVDLVIEREAGAARVEDICSAAALVRARFPSLV
jgi:sugar phosphate isomerase/epimerase